MDASGLGYSESGDGLFAFMLRDQRRGILVFTPDGTLLHEVDIPCGASGGVAFASGLRIRRVRVKGFRRRYCDDGRGEAPGLGTSPGFEQPASGIPP